LIIAATMQYSKLLLGLT